MDGAAENDPKPEPEATVELAHGGGDSEVPAGTDGNLSLDSLGANLLGSQGASRSGPTPTTGSHYATSYEGISRQAGKAARRVLRADEAARAAGFARALMALTSVTMISIPWLGGVRWLQVLTEVSLASMFVVALVVARRAADPKRYGKTLFRTLAWACVPMSVVIEYYLGVFSPVALVVTLGISFIATGFDRGAAIAAPITAALLYFVLAALIVTGVIPDLGVFDGEGKRLEVKLFFVVMVPVVMAYTARVSRLGRNILYRSVEDAHHAALLAGMREAQLAEVKQDLDAALAAGAGVGGRYSGARMGDFELGAVIGRGAMGEVYAATATDADTPAAVKVLAHGMRGRPHVVARFAREAEITAKLEVPNVVRVLQTGTAADGTPFIAMERLRGRDLSWHLRQRGMFSVADALMLVEQAARGIDAAHGAGVVHRDVKPRNLFLHETDDGEEQWKVLDFGVSKLRDSTGTLTEDGVVGTPAYMAPEQADGKEVDARSDLFALGAVLYRVLTGRPPFSGESPAQILYEVVHRQPPRPTKLVPELSSQVELVLALALAKDPRYRFSSGNRLFECLLAASRGELPRSVSARARKLLGKHPWGSKRGKKK